MKIENSTADIQSLAKLIDSKLRVRLFTCQSCDSKYDAQRNLDGRTHYVDDDTLRWHKSRITSGGYLHAAQGLLYRLTESVALDMHNRSRGFRCVVFDVFGTTVYHPDLEHAFSSSAKAEKACNETPFDLVGHYRDAIKSKLQQAEQEAADLLSVAQGVAALEVVSNVIAERV